MKLNLLPLRSEMNRFLPIGRLFAVLFATCLAGSASAATYTWGGTSGAAYSDTTSWVGGVVPGAADTITINGATAMATRFNGGTFAVASIVDSATTAWTFQSFSGTTVLNVGSLQGGSNTFQFQNGATAVTNQLRLNVENIDIASGILYLGGSSTLNSSSLYALDVSGTTNLTGARINVNVNGPGQAYSLGTLNVTSGTVSLNLVSQNNRGNATANVDGLMGSGGQIQNSFFHNTSGNSSTLVITNTANYSTGTVLANGGTAGNITGPLSLVKAGSGTQTLTAASTYTGGTTVTAGTLLITSTSGVGTGAVSISEGVLHVNALSGSGAITNAVTITDGDGGYVLERASGMAFSAYTASSDIVGGDDTIASLLAGAASTARTLTTGFDSAASVTPTNDGLRASDVFSLDGTGADLFVLQLEIADLNATHFLGWLDGSDTWINAVSGNTGNNASLAQQGYLGSFAAFQTAFGSDLSTYVGAYGVDDSGDRVWAVLNHNSEFAVIPEPSTWALLAIGLGSFALINAKRRRLGRER